MLIVAEPKLLGGPTSSLIVDEKYFYKYTVYDDTGKVIGMISTRRLKALINIELGIPETV